MRNMLSVAAAAGLLFGTSALCLAQGGAQDNAPGQKYRIRDRCEASPAPPATPRSAGEDKGSKPGQPGASGYARVIKTQQVDKEAVAAGLIQGLRSHADAMRPLRIQPLRLILRRVW